MSPDQAGWGDERCPLLAIRDHSGAADSLVKLDRPHVADHGVCIPYDRHIVQRGDEEPRADTIATIAFADTRGSEVTTEGEVIEREADDLAGSKRDEALAGSRAYATAVAPPQFSSLNADTTNVESRS